MIETLQARRNVYFRFFVFVLSVRQNSNTQTFFIETECFLLFLYTRYFQFQTV